VATIYQHRPRLLSRNVRLYLAAETLTKFSMWGGGIYSLLHNL